MGCSLCHHKAAGGLDHTVVMIGGRRPRWKMALWQHATLYDTHILPVVAGWSNIIWWKANSAQPMLNNSLGRDHYITTPFYCWRRFAGGVVIGGTSDLR